MSWTPAPWHIEHDPEDDERLLICGDVYQNGKSSILATVEVLEDEDAANATLMSTAPALYAASMEVYEAICSDWGAKSPLAEQLGAALQKARGVGT